MDETLQEQRHQFFFETPLYTAFNLGTIDSSDFLSGDVDGYNHILKENTTYEVFSSRVEKYGYWEQVMNVTLECKRKDNEIAFLVIEKPVGLLKIGQYPSLADIQFAKISKKYDKLLSKEDLQNYKLGIGLAAHGVGAGSLLYLRRIFENLIEKALIENKSNISVKEAEFHDMRMADKVELLKGFLPSKLVEMKSIYGILSTGLHGLSEEECKSYFPALKLSIELILDEELEKKRKKADEEKTNKAINDINSTLGLKK